MLIAQAHLLKRYWAKYSSSARLARGCYFVCTSDAYMFCFLNNFYFFFRHNFFSEFYSTNIKARRVHLCVKRIGHLACWVDNNRFFGLWQQATFSNLDCKTVHFIFLSAVLTKESILFQSRVKLFFFSILLLNS